MKTNSFLRVFSFLLDIQKRKIKCKTWIISSGFLLFKTPIFQFSFGYSKEKNKMQNMDYQFWFFAFQNTNFENDF